METNLKTVAQEICRVVGGTSDVSIDGSDMRVKEAGDGFSFTCVKHHEKKVPGQRRGEPIGHVEYTVTVTARYVPFDDEVV